MKIARTIAERNPRADGPRPDRRELRFFQTAIDAPREPIRTIHETHRKRGIERVHSQDGGPVPPTWMCEVYFTCMEHTCACAPGYAGLYQLNVTVPFGLPSGANPVAIQTGQAFSNTATIVMK